MIKPRKILIIIPIVVIVSVVLIGVYYFRDRSQVGEKIPDISPSSESFSQTEKDIDLASQQASGAQAGREIILMFNMLQSVKIDLSFFNNKTFQSLIDYSKDLPEEKIGRENPFAPIGQ